MTWLPSGPPATPGPAHVPPGPG